MHNVVRINPNKISRSKWKKVQLAIFMMVTWYLLQVLILLPFWLTTGISAYWSTVLIIIGTMAYLLFWKKNLNLITGKVSLNRAIALFDEFTKGARAVFEGFYFKLPWEVIEVGEDQLDLTASFTEPEGIKEDFPCSDGSVEVEISLLSKIDSAEGYDEVSRSERILTHCLFLGQAPKLQRAEAVKVIRPEFVGITVAQALALPNEEVLGPDDLYELSRDIAIRILKCNVEDIDLNKATQAQLNKLQKVTVIEEMTKRLRPIFGDKAGERALLIDNDTDYKEDVRKIVLEGGFTGKLEGGELSPAILELIEKVTKKYLV